MVLLVKCQFLDSLKSISEEDKKAVEKVLNALKEQKKKLKKLVFLSKFEDNVLTGFKKDFGLLTKL